jgi:hypothetical protein
MFKTIGTLFATAAIMVFCGTAQATPLEDAKRKGAEMMVSAFASQPYSPTVEELMALEGWDIAKRMQEYSLKNFLAEAGLDIDTDPTALDWGKHNWPEGMTDLTQARVKFWAQATFGILSEWEDYTKMDMWERRTFDDFLFESSPKDHLFQANYDARKKAWKDQLDRTGYNSWDEYEVATKKRLEYLSTLPTREELGRKKYEEHMAKRKGFGDFMEALIDVGRKSAKLNRDLNKLKRALTDEPKSRRGPGAGPSTSGPKASGSGGPDKGYRESSDCSDLDPRHPNYQTHLTICGHIGTVQSRVQKQQKFIDKNFGGAWMCQGDYGNGCGK